MGYFLTERDQQELAEVYPLLNCSLPRAVIWGTLDFSCSYDVEKRQLVHSNSFDNYLVDDYEIRIDFNDFDDFGFPKVYEESSRIKQFAKAEGISLMDLHVNIGDNCSCCLGVFPEYKYVGALEYIQDKLIPFFYWQSYRRINGKEPWKGLSHGEPGIREAMTRLVKDVEKGKYRNCACPCGREPIRKYKNCCLRRDLKLKRYLINRNKMTVV